MMNELTFLTAGAITGRAVRVVLYLTLGLAAYMTGSKLGNGVAVLAALLAGLMMFDIILICIKRARAK